MSGRGIRPPVLLALGSVAVACVLALGGCGEDSGATAEGRDEAILEAVERGRDALLEGDGPQACALLTQGGRRRALNYRVNFDQGGLLAADDPRVPQTCEEIATAMVQEARIHEGLTWDADLQIGRFEVVSRSETAAVVALVLPDPYVDVKLELRSTDDGWRIDDSNIIPFGH